jgi:hypothetical protein
MTNGKFLAKTNQRTINALIPFLVWIVFFHSTSCNPLVLGVQASRRSPKMPSKTILFTHNGHAIATSSFLQLPHNSPHFKQTFVPTTTSTTGLQAYNNCHTSLNNVTAPQAFSTTSAITTATMNQVSAMATMTQFPTIATMTQVPAISTMTQAPAIATTTQVPAVATMTQIPAIIIATTKAELLKLDECFLHPTKSVPLMQQ